jgi:hypothetical protein
VLPRQQEPHEAGRVDRLDRGPPPTPHAGVDGGQDVAAAPLVVVTEAEVVAADEGVAPLLEDGQPDLDPCGTQACLPAELVDGHRPPPAELSFDDLSDGHVGIDGQVGVDGRLVGTGRRRGAVSDFPGGPAGTRALYRGVDDRRGVGGVDPRSSIGCAPP